MKRIISLLLLSILVVGAFVPAYAEDNTVFVTLEQAIEMAQENSIIIKNYDNNILIAERNLKSAIHQADVVRMDKSLADLEYLSNGRTKDLVPLQKEKIITDLKSEKVDTLNSIRLEVTSAYVSLKHEILGLESSIANLDVQKKELESKNKELSLGLTTKNTVLDLENSIASSELDIKKTQWSIEMAQMDLAKTLGVDLNTKFKLANDTDLTASYSYDIEQIAIQAIDMGAGVVKAEANLAMKKIEKDIEIRYTLYKRPEGAEDFDKSIVDLEKALEDAKVAEEVKVRSDYNGILNAELDLEISKLKLEIAERTLNTNQIKYDLGMIVYLEVTKAQNSLDSAKVDIQSKELALYKAVENFNYYIKDFVTE